MKSLFSMAALLLASFIAVNASAGLPVPAGTYKGKGQLVRFTDGQKFSYDATYVIGKDSVTVNYVYPGNVTYTLPFTTKDSTLGQFTVAIEGQTAGSGYCIDISCHVDVTFPVSGVLETDSLNFTWAGKNKHRLIISGKNTTTNTAFEDIVSQ